MSQPLILTLKLDQTSFDRFNELRQQYFPSERNVLPAHVTLFHALPGNHALSICQLLQTISSQTPRLPLHFPNPRFLGRGVAINVQCPELAGLRQHLADQWSDWLSKQDQQSYRSHITIQNKVVPDDARRLYEHLRQEWTPLNGHAEGLLLWHYQGGPWALAAEFLFTAT